MRNHYQFSMHVAYRCGSVLLGRATQSQGKGAIWGAFFPIENALYGPFSGMNFAMKDRSGLNLLLYDIFKSNRIQFPIIKRHNCD